MTTCAQRIKDALRDADTNGQNWRQMFEQEQQRHQQTTAQRNQLEQSRTAMRVQISWLEDENEKLRAERLELLALAYPVGGRS